MKVFFPYGSIVGAMIEDESVGAADLGPDSVNTSELVDAAVTEAKIAAAAVTAAKLGYAPDAIVMAQRGATDLLSGANLKAAYLAACALSPTVDHRVLIIALGRFDFGAVAFNLDTDFVDILGEGVCRCDRDPAITWVGAPYASPTVSINDSLAIFHWPDSHLVGNTDDEVVNVTCRDILLKGFLIEQETSGKDGLRIDNANACDRGRFIDLGFKMASIHDEAILDGTSTEIASYFENCHTLARLLGDCATLSGACRHCTGGGRSFAYEGTASGTFTDCFGSDYGFAYEGIASGTFTDCITGGDGFGTTASGAFIRCLSGINSFKGLSGTCIDCFCRNGCFADSTPAAVLHRCTWVSEYFGVLAWQGTMIDCDIEVTAADKDAVELKANLLGSGAETADASSTTTNISIVGPDCTAAFPVGSYVKHVADGTWHRITASVFSGPDDTDLTVSPAAVTEWVGESVRAQTAPRIIDCRLTATAEAIDADAETPVVVRGLVSDQAWDVVNCVNVANIYDQVFWDDLRIAGLALTLGAQAPGLEVFRDGLKLYAFAAAGPVEEVHFTVQLPHSYKEGTDLIPHVHWGHKIAAPGDNLGVSWKMEYAWVNQSGVLGASTTIEAAEEWTTSPPVQYKSIYTAFPSISGVGKTISSQLVCRLYRDNADDQDDFVEDVMLVEVDFHYQMDSPGSKRELVK